MTAKKPNNDFSLEKLEDRCVPALINFTGLGPTGLGRFEDVNVWAGGVVPGAGDVARFAPTAISFGVEMPALSSNNPPVTLVGVRSEGSKFTDFRVRQTVVLTGAGGEDSLLVRGTNPADTSDFRIQNGNPNNSFVNVEGDVLLGDSAAFMGKGILSLCNGVVFTQNSGKDFTIEEGSELVVVGEATLANVDNRGLIRVVDGVFNVTTPGGLENTGGVVLIIEDSKFEINSSTQVLGSATDQGILTVDDSNGTFAEVIVSKSVAAQGKESLLEVKNGSVVSIDGLQVGNADPAVAGNPKFNAFANITGESQVTIKSGGFLDVGTAPAAPSGNGVVTVDDATLEFERNPIPDGEVSIGDGAKKNGTLNVTNEGEVKFFDLDKIDLGVGSGFGNLNILSGSTVTIDEVTRIAIGENLGSGQVVIDGADSQLNVSNVSTFEVGNDGVGVISVSDGGRFTAGDLELGFDPTGVGAFLGGTIEVAGENSVGIVGKLSAGDLSATNAVNVVSGFFSANELEGIEVDIKGGILNVDFKIGPKTTIKADDNAAWITPGIVIADAGVEIDDSTALLGALEYSDDWNSSSSIISIGDFIAAAGVFDFQSSDDQITSNRFVFESTSDASTVLIDGSTVSLTGDTGFVSTGSEAFDVTLDDASITSSAGDFTATGQFLTVQSGLTNVVDVGGAVSFDGDSTVLGGGSYKGAEVFLGLNEGTTFSPGFTPGDVATVNLEGFTTAGDGFHLLADVGLDGVGNEESDLISVNGTFNLDGEIEVSSTDSLSFVAGDTFELIHASDLFGQFDNLGQGVYGSHADLPELSTGLSWAVEYLSTDSDLANEVLQLTVVQNETGIDIFRSTYEEVTVDYTVAGNPGGGGTIEILRVDSATGVRTVIASTAANSTVGQHEFTTTLSFTDPGTDYYLVATYTPDAGTVDNVASNNEVMFAGGAFDVIDGGQTDLHIHGTPGDDNVQFFQFQGQFYVTINDQTLSPGNDDVADVYIRVHGGNDVVDATGFENPLIVFGGDGDDIIEGGTQDDILNGGAGNDIINGNEGCDVIDGVPECAPLMGGSSGGGGSTSSTVGGGSAFLSAPLPEASVVSSASSDGEEFVSVSGTETFVFQSSVSAVESVSDAGEQRYRLAGNNQELDEIDVVFEELGHGAELWF